MDNKKAETAQDFRGTIVLKKAGTKLHPPRLTIKFAMITSPQGGEGYNENAPQIEGRVTQEDFAKFNSNDTIDGKIISEEDGRNIFRDLRPAMG